jgi:hypothetical protein
MDRPSWPAGGGTARLRCALSGLGVIDVPPYSPTGGGDAHQSGLDLLFLPGFGPLEDTLAAETKSHVPKWQHPYPERYGAGGSCHSEPSAAPKKR